MSPRRRGAGGQGGSEPRARIRTRESRALELAVLGRSQYEIAAELGISQAAVSKMLKRIELRLFREHQDTRQRHTIRQTLRLEHLYTEAMQAWRESHGDSTRRRQRKTQGGTTARGGTQVAEVVTENQYGDPRYLTEARHALADMRKVWGLDAPKQVELSAGGNPYGEMTEAELLEHLHEQRRLLEPVMEAGDSVPGPPEQTTAPVGVIASERDDPNAD